MTKIPFAFALTALFFASAAATAQPSQPDPAVPNDAPILVEGQRPDPSEIVRGTINRAGIAPLARFEDKICPGVVGLGSEQAERLVQMIRRDIVALGGKLHGPGCTANATVIFTEQPVDLIKQLAKKEPGYFDFSPSAFERFTARPRPVASWHVTETRDRDGNELGSADRIADKKRMLFNKNVPVSEPMDARVLRNSGATRLYTNSREDMLFGFAVIDAARTRDKTMAQLSGLATMHLLLDVNQDASAINRGSILALFEERPTGMAAPDGLSAIDRAMIEGLYRPNENNRSASQQFSQIATAVRRTAGKDSR